MRDHAHEAASILGRYGYSFELARAERRYALLERHQHEPDSLEDALLLPHSALSNI
jgi:hypothetical protein